MPVYQYACTECGEQLEVRQSFTDAALTECPACEGRLRKVLNAVGVVFKGSGFYRTDSRATPTKTGDTAPATGSAGKAEQKGSPGGDAANGSSPKTPASSGSGSSGKATPAPAATH